MVKVGDKKGFVYTDSQIIEGIKHAKGIIALAADYVGCGRRTIYRRIEQSNAVYEALWEARERVVDLAENRLYNILNDKNHPNHYACVTFVLDRLGKQRGWGKELSVSYMDKDRLLEDEVDLNKLDDNELDQLEQLMLKAKNGDNTETDPT